MASLRAAILAIKCTCGDDTFIGAAERSMAESEGYYVGSVHAFTDLYMDETDRILLDLNQDSGDGPYTTVEQSIADKIDVPVSEVADFLSVYDLHIG